MSADNYLYVAKRGDQYVVVMRFASSDYPDEVDSSEHPEASCDTALGAHQEALRLDYIGEPYTEYGVSMSPLVARELGFVQ